MEIPLTIIIPAKHEETSIVQAIAALSAVKTPHTILVVCDTDADDETYRLVPKQKNLRLIRRVNSQGTFGSAMVLGIANTHTTYFIPFMADLCDDPRVVDRMATLMQQGFDVVAASRYASGGKKIGGPIVQSVLSRFVCRSVQLLTHIPTSDISNAFKMYRTSLVRRMPMDGTLGVEFSMHLTLALYWNGARIGELPTVWQGRTRGVSKFRFWQRLPKYARIYSEILFHSVSPHPSTGA